MNGCGIGFEERVKELAKSAEKYYNAMKICPTGQEIAEYVFCELKDNEVSDDEDEDFQRILDTLEIPVCRLCGSEVITDDCRNGDCRRNR
jgi:hypothetical protein